MFDPGSVGLVEGIARRQHPCRLFGDLEADRSGQGGADHMARMKVQAGRLAGSELDPADVCSLDRRRANKRRLKEILTCDRRGIAHSPPYSSSVTCSPHAAVAPS